MGSIPLIANHQTVPVGIVIPVLELFQISVTCYLRGFCSLYQTPVYDEKADAHDHAKEKLD